MAVASAKKRAKISVVLRSIVSNFMTVFEKE